MTNIKQARERLVRRIVDGDGRLAQPQRRAAFDHALAGGPLQALIGKVAKHAYRVTDEDFTAARATGLSEDEMFELVVCGAVGEADRQYDGALAALDRATGGK